MYPKGVHSIQTRTHAKLVDLIIAARQKADLRQIDVAKRLKQRQAWVSHIESGQRRIDVVEFLALANAIGFDPVRLLRMLVRVKG